jgi:DNA-directed RNA polymerase specialized sigma24 family protein
MMRFTDQIHRAFLETVRSGALPGADDLPERLRDFSIPGDELDQLWVQALDGYRTGPRQAWATVLLEAMRPDLAAAVVAVPAVPPAITREELAQHLIVEVLTAASEGPSFPARWTPNRLISRASRETARWFARELRALSHGVGNLDQTAKDPKGSELPAVLYELETRAKPSAGLVILYREEVLGDSLVELAQETGLSEDALRQRRNRAIERIKRDLAA